VEHHGKNPRQLVFAIIPARYSSVRLPGKLLLPIAGKPLILHTLEQAKLAKNVDEVIVATDDQRIFDIVTQSGNRAVMTSTTHQSGSDRIAEVALDLPEGSIIVNVQGDEPLISPNTIDRAVKEIVECGMRNADSADTRCPDIVTTFEHIESLEELENPNIVKVVTNEAGRALYFSRSPMPFPREAALKRNGPQSAIVNEPELLKNFKKHTGLYVYRREYLLEFTKMPQTHLEKLEMLEQLRALENGAYIKVVESAANSIGVDTAEDLKKVRALVETSSEFLL